MKRHWRLFEQIVNFENLLLAARKARRGKRHRPDVAAFHHNLETELLRLQAELTAHTYRPGAYREFVIHDPKRRVISAAPYRDRVVHHALCNVLEPLFERVFISDSYAHRKGKGTHAAVDRLTIFMQRYDYVLKCDIAQYFPSIDHAILKMLIRRKIACTETLGLVDTILDASNPQELLLRYYPGDNLFTPIARRAGLPLGNQTSQFFANIYLNALDHFVKERLGCRAYIRYVDDFVVLADDKVTLWSIRDAVATFLATTLRLTLHPVKQWVLPVTSGVDFLGYQVFPTHRRLRRSSGLRFQRRLRGMQRAYREGRITLQQIQQRLMAWLGHARHADTYRLRASLLGAATFRRDARRETACCGVARGTTTRTTPVARTATTTTRTTTGTTTGSVASLSRQVSPRPSGQAGIPPTTVAGSAPGGVHAPCVPVLG
jgi:retron-type reverse transcriptase